jgi:hypothetical protein
MAETSTLGESGVGPWAVLTLSPVAHRAGILRGSLLPEPLSWVWAASFGSRGIYGQCAIWGPHILDKDLSCLPRQGSEHMAVKSPIQDLG